MIKNYIKIAWRNLKNQKLFSLIKIGGFSFGIAVCLLIVLFVKHELSYDNFYPDSDRLYRMIGNFKTDNGFVRGIHMQAPAGEAMKEKFPSIEQYGRILASSLFGAGSNQVSTEADIQNRLESGFVYADQSIMDMFPLPTVYGTLAHALDKPNTIVITKTKAGKLFKGNPVGQIIYLNNKKETPYEITAVIEDIPTNSHLYGFDFFMTLEGVNFYQGEQENWLATNYATYFKIRPRTDLKNLEKQLSKTYINDYYIPAALKAGRTINPRVKSSFLTLQPVHEIHLYSRDVSDDKVAIENRGDIRIVWIFGSISGFILLLATINFINLSTANAATRAKEVGIRKTVGSSRNSLMAQFMTESFLYCAISVLLGIVVSAILLPAFNHLAGKSLTIPWLEGQFVLSIILCIILLGSLSGIYPSFFLSGFKPIAVLKGKLLSSSTGSGVFRNGLVVFQFVTSIILIIGTLIANQQLNYLLNKDLGYAKEQVLIIQGTNTLGQQVKSFKEELKAIPSVSSATISAYVPVEMNGSQRNGNSFWQDGKQSVENGKGGQFWIIDQDYIPTFGLNLVAGRNLSFDMPTDSAGAIVNQKMVEELGIKDPVGAKIFNGETRTIVGVVEDFIFENMRGDEAIRPLCMVLGGSPLLVSVKTKTGDIKTTIEQVTRIWDRFSPNQKIQYSFLDDNFAALYKDVRQTQSIFTSFAIIAIMIACLGLFGLAAFITQQRTKEIGIRKVLGASLPEMIRLLSSEFVKLVLIALVIACPIAWWAMTNWLQDFHYRISIHVWVFIFAGVVSVVIAFATICYHTLKIAMINPVDSLRDE